MDDKNLWPLACEFFLHDVKKDEEGVWLPGFSKQSHPYQMLDVVKILQVCASKKFNRRLNGSKPGMGQTLEVFVAVRAIALAFLSQDHYLKNKDRHNLKGGHQCYCIEGGFTRKLCKRIRRAPQLVFNRMPSG